MTLLILRRITGSRVGEGAVSLLVKIVRVTVLVNLLMFVSELFTEFYTGGAHAASAEYLFFGLHGKTGLVPWTWTSVALNLISAAVFLCPRIDRRTRLLAFGCACAFVGIWIEKGMGLIIPGFIPSTLHQIVEYSPSLLEWKVTAGIWAFALLVYTVALKIAARVLSGEMTIGGTQARA